MKTEYILFKLQDVTKTPTGFYRYFDGSKETRTKSRNLVRDKLACGLQGGVHSACFQEARYAARAHVQLHNHTLLDDLENPHRAHAYKTTSYSIYAGAEKVFYVVGCAPYISVYELDAKPFTFNSYQLNDAGQSLMLLPGSMDEVLTAWETFIGDFEDEGRAALKAYIIGLDDDASWGKRNPLRAHEQEQAKELIAYLRALGVR